MQRGPWMDISESSLRGHQNWRQCDKEGGGEQIATGRGLKNLTIRQVDLGTTKAARTKWVRTHYTNWKKTGVIPRE